METFEFLTDDTILLNKIGVISIHFDDASEEYFRKGMVPRGGVPNAYFVMMLEKG